MCMLCYKGHFSLVEKYLGQIYRKCKTGVSVYKCRRSRSGGACRGIGKGGQASLISVQMGDVLSKGAKCLGASKPRVADESQRDWVYILRTPILRRQIVMLPTACIFQKVSLVSRELEKSCL